MIDRLPTRLEREPREAHMSAANLLDEVRAVFVRDLLPWRFTGRGDVVIVHSDSEAAVGDRAAWCREVAAVLTAAGFHCTRSRTRVRVRREAPVLGEPDFVQRRRA